MGPYSLRRRRLALAYRLHYYKVIIVFHIQKTPLPLFQSQGQVEAFCNADTETFINSKLLRQTFEKILTLEKKVHKSKDS